MLQLYRKRGYDVYCHFEDNKNAVFRIADIDYCNLHGSSHHPWIYQPGFNSPGELDWSGNKTALNLNQQPLPEIGERGELWEELCAVKLDGTKIVSPALREDALRFLDALPRPIVLLHSHGTNYAGLKNIFTTTCEDLYPLLLDANLSLVLLDWDNRVPRLKHGRVRHVKQDWGHISLDQLAAIYTVVAEQGGCLIGVDSGAFHYSNFFPLPALGVFTQHYPSCVCLPSEYHAHLTPARACNASRRQRWSILDYQTLTAETIARHALRLLDRRYVQEPGRDLMLQQWVRDFSRTSTPLCRYADRSNTLDWVLRRLPTQPTIVETGCIRAKEDWSAGMSTLIFAALGGKLTSVDISPDNLAVARQETAGWAVEFVRSDSVTWLKSWQGQADLVYLDTADDPAVALAEAQACQGKTGLILIDDTVWDGGWAGKGRLAVPWLREQGWQIGAVGYQVALTNLTT